MIALNEKICLREVQSFKNVIYQEKCRKFTQSEREKIIFKNKIFYENLRSRSFSLDLWY